MNSAFDVYLQVAPSMVEATEDAKDSSDGPLKWDLLICVGLFVAALAGKSKWHLISC